LGQIHQFTGAGPKGRDAPIATVRETAIELAWFNPNQKILSHRSVMAWRDGVRMTAHVQPIPMPAQQAILRCANLALLDPLLQVSCNAVAE
jgi:hypothetical protein